jgi:hypothetical protein
MAVIVAILGSVGVVFLIGQLAWERTYIGEKRPLGTAWAGIVLVGLAVALTVFLNVSPVAWILPGIIALIGFIPIVDSWG